MEITTTCIKNIQFFRLIIEVLIHFFRMITRETFNPL